MYTALRVVTPPASEPVLLADAKQHLRVDQSCDDAYISGLITSARMMIEEWSGRSLITQTLNWTMSQSVPSGALPLLPMPMLVLPIILTAPQIINKPLQLPRSPVQSVSSVMWTDTDGTQYPLTAGTDYMVDTALEPARVRLTWLTIPRYLENIQVQFVAGYGSDGTTTPAPLISAIKLLLAWLYEHRGDDAAAPDTPPRAIDYLITPYRTGWFNA
jgi:hypothetical protein